jgi:hypothetical protein
MEVLVEETDWAKVKECKGAQNLNGEISVQEMVDKHLAEAEKLTENPKAVEAVLTAEEPKT